MIDTYTKNYLCFSGDRVIEAPVVVKSIPKNIARRKTYRSTEFFETEINFYTKVFKIIYFFLQKNAN